jgi:hypothetical protein
MASPFAQAAAIHDTALFSDHTLPPFDDNNSGNFPMFPINFIGTSALALSVNSNGALTHANLWPINFNQLQQGTSILAPFFANVDNRLGGLIQWGFDVIDGRQVLGAQWLNVAAYNHPSDKTNSFQLILSDRSDVAAGDFDFEFNYDRITWDTTGHAWWDADAGPDVARAGWSNNLTGEYFEFAGSGIAGALLDNNLETGLIHHSRNSDVMGRYIFQMRGGQVLPAAPVPEASTWTMLLAGLGMVGLMARRRFV